jgi:hypothetical protein
VAEDKVLHADTFAASGGSCHDPAERENTIELREFALLMFVRNALAGVDGGSVLTHFLSF